jgi:hypothetical protein
MMTYDSLPLYRAFCRQLGAPHLILPHIRNWYNYIVIHIFLSTMAALPRVALSTRFASRALAPVTLRLAQPIVARSFHSTPFNMSQHPIATLQVGTTST